MNNIVTSIFSEIAAILLFFYSIHRFSKIIARCNIHAMKNFMQRITNNCVKSTLIGAGAAALMQSNKAVSSIALTLVNAGIITAIGSLPILFGTPIGAASTAFLVSLKSENMEEILIIIGAIFKKTKYKNIGHIIFYLGLLLFSLELMSKATITLKDMPEFKSIFLFSNNSIILFFVGCLFSLLLQSGALITSIITILVNCSVLPLYNAVAMGIGVTVGSTLSLYIVATSMNNEAKKACYIYLSLILTCGIIFLPFAQVFTIIGNNFSGGMGFAVANFAARTAIALTGLLMFIFLYHNKTIREKIMQYLHKISKNDHENYITNVK